MSNNSGRTTGGELILTDENKISHGIQFMHKINAGLDARRCRGIANGTEIYPVNRENPVVNPRGEPVEPAQPVLLPGNGANAREHNKILMDGFRSDRNFWQNTISRLKDDRDSWTNRHADGFGYIISHLSEGLQSDLHTIIDRNDIQQLYQAIEQQIAQRNDAELTKLVSDYYTLKQQEEQSLKDYQRLRSEFEATLTKAGRGVTADVAKINFINTVLPCYNHTVATISATQPFPDMDRIMKLLTAEETKNIGYAARATEEIKLLQRVVALEAQNKALVIQLKDPSRAPTSSILAITEAISKPSPKPSPSLKSSKVKFKTSVTDSVPCSKCGKNGHNALDCYSDVQCPHCKGFGHPPTICWSITPCKSCGKIGHPQLRCPERKRKAAGIANMVTGVHTDDSDDHSLGFFD